MRYAQRLLVLSPILLFASSIAWAQGEVQAVAVDAEPIWRTGREQNTGLTREAFLARNPDEAGREDPWAAAAKPTLITLDLENALWREAFLALDEASGGQLEVPKADSEYSLPISMEFRDVPFLEALDIMRRVAPVSYNTNYARPAFQINWNSNNERMDYVAYPGPARIMLANYQIQRTSYLNFQSGRRRERMNPPSSYLSMQVTLEPRLRIAAIALELAEMTDDTGRNLLETEDADRPLGRYSQQWRSPQAFNTQVQIHAGIPAKNAKALKSIKGKLVLSILPDLPPLQLQLAGENQEIKMPDGAYKLAAVETEENGQLKVIFSVPPDFDRGHSYARFQEARLGSPEGNEDRTQTRQPNVTFRHREENLVELELRFTVPEGFNPTVLTIPAPAAPEDFEFPVEFADIPLPPLESIYFAGTPLETAGAPVAPEPMPPAPDHLLPLDTLKASVFSVDVGQQPILSVMDFISARTGNPIEMPDYRPMREGAEERPSPAVTLRIEEAPFWQAMDELCRKGGYRMSFSSRRGYDYFLALNRDNNENENPYVQDVGPLRFSVTNISLQAQCGINYQYQNSSPQDNLALYVNGQTWVEPRIALVRHGASVEVCRAEDGSDLLQTANRSSGSDIHRALNDPRLTRHINSTANPMDNFSTNIPLKGRAIPKRIEEMTLYYFMAAAEKEQTIEITDLEKVMVYDIEGGGSVRWAGIQERNNRSCLRYGIDLPETTVNADMQFYRRTFEAFDAEGNPIENLRPNTNRMGPGFEVMTCYFNENQKPAKVILKVPSGLKTYAGTVTFKDIELPELPELPN